MLLRDLRLQKWRNFEEGHLRLGDRVTVLFGQNGQGKTNLLEAAYYALTFRSFRTSASRDLVGWGGCQAELEAQIFLRGLERTLRVVVGEGKKITALDGKGVRRDSDALEGAGVVVFAPEDLRLLKAAASDRRRALDRAVFSVRRSYYREAIGFERALKARNVLLRQGGGSPSLLESYDETLSLTGARIVMRRREVMRNLAPRFSRCFQEIHGRLTSSMRYRSHESVEEASTEQEVEQALRVGLGLSRNRDQKRGFTGFGPQTDDFEVLLEDRLARDHGSQGQIRSLTLAFKIAELQQASEQNGEAPLLLLDDVASELDEERRKRLFESISAMACQTLITVTERDHLPALPGRVDLRIANGKIEAF